jgi:hypothetical protein
MSLLQKAYASNGGAVPTEVTKIQLGNITSLSDAFGLIINVVLGVGVALTIIFLILGGIQYITSKGDQKAAQEARTSLTNAVIGFIVVIGAFTIRTVLLSVIGIDEGSLEVTNVTPTF